MDTYREEILEHWQNPQNYGEMEGADLVIDQVNPLCGDEVTFYFRIRERISDKSKITNTKYYRKKPKAKGEKRIADVSFVGKGCAISVASASILSEKMKGKSVRDLAKLTGEDVFKLLGGPVAPARLKCAFLPLEVVKKLIG